MLRNLLIVVLATIAFTTTSLAVFENHVPHEERTETSERWIKRGRVGNRILPVRIGLAQSNLDKAHDYLMNVSDPSSPSYGEHWSAEDIIHTFQPSNQTVRAVHGWLIDGGIPAEKITHSDNKAWFAFHVPAEQMERLLHTTFYEFEDAQTGGRIPACKKYYVPEHVKAHVDFVSPGIKLIAPLHSLHRGRGRSTIGKKHSWHGDRNHNLSTCDEVMTPACIAALYQIPPASKHGVSPTNRMGIFEAQNYFWSQEDLDSFFTSFTSNIPNGTHPISINVDGGQGTTNNVSADGMESMLDLAVAYPIVYPQKIKMYSVDDSHYQSWANDTYTWGFNTLLDAIDGSYCHFSAFGETGNLPGVDPTYPDPEGYKGKLQCGVFKHTNVMSISYGGQEFDIPISYQKRQCIEYLKLGLQGISVLFASGDSGIGNYPHPYGTNGPTGCLGPNHDVFNPTWPGTCPYVTSVGATKVYPGKTVFDPESAVYDQAGHPYAVNYSSGGGFSNVYPAPSYQASAIAGFFDEHEPGLPYYTGLARDNPEDPYAHLNVTTLASGSSDDSKRNGVYSRHGRGIPDVSANGDNIAYYQGGKFGTYGGTSAAAPLFASVINRINEERLAVGKRPVGFINPVLYAHPEVLNDITNGTNKACVGEGFTAVKGWDPVTGLGTPNFPRMLELFMRLP